MNCSLNMIRLFTWFSITLRGSETAYIRIERIFQRILLFLVFLRKAIDSKVELTRFVFDGKIIFFLTFYGNEIEMMFNR